MIINNVDSEYFRILNLILNEGRLKKNRTGIDTIGVFGAQAKFDVNLNAFPILTTKKVWFKGIVHELLWFINGDTNIKYLVDNDVHIWDEWAYAKYEKAVRFGITCFNETNCERGISPYKLVIDGSNAEIPTYTKYNQEGFISRIKSDSKFAEKWGELGVGTYGSMWRSFPYWDTDELIEDGEVVDTEYKYGGVDQLKNIIDKLKTNPDDRRMIISAWHPYWVEHCALPPCHCLFHFNTEELTDDERDALATDEQRSMAGNIAIDASDKSGTYSEELTKLGVPRRRLNVLLYQRSCDTFLGVPFNITSYSLLLAMVAHCVHMVPGTFTHTYGDLHIYSNHMKQIKLQLDRSPMLLPSLWINPNVRDLFQLKYEDIKLENYQSHPPIKGEVAV